MANADKPNILVIWGDDIGITNLSCYSDGLMGYRTPNIDRIADEGMRFTDSYGEQSCTAGRSSFITGQSVYRTGLSKVGVPGMDIGLQAEDVDDRRAAEAARLRDRAVRQEPPRRPEQVPADGARLRRVLRQPLPPERGGGAGAAELAAAPTTSRNFSERFGPRGVIHSWATDEDDDTEEPRFGRVGKQRIEDTGPLTKKRMETIDDEMLEHGHRLHRAPARRRHAVLRLDQHDPHALPHAPEAGERRPGGPLAVALPRHDDRPRQASSARLLDKLDELGIAENTIVVYSTDNGPHMNSWPDAGMTPFRSEKNTNWEGAFRVPELIRWPGKIPAGDVSNEIVQHHDWLPTFLAAAGDADIVEKLKAGHTIGDTTFKVHIDGYNLLPYLTGETDKSPRPGLRLLLRRRRRARAPLRQLEGRLHGAAGAGDAADLGRAVRAAPRPEAVQPAHRSVRARRRDLEHLLRLVPRQRLHRAGRRRRSSTQFLETFKEFPPRQEAASFTIDQVVEKLEAALAAGH